MTQFLSCAFIGIEKTRSVSNRVVLFRLALRVLVVVVTCAGVFFTRQWVVSFEPNPLRTTRPRKTHRVPRLRGHQKAVLVPPAEKHAVAPAHEPAPGAQGGVVGEGQ